MEVSQNFQVLDTCLQLQVSASVSAQEGKKRQRITRPLQRHFRQLGGGHFGGPTRFSGFPCLSHCLHDGLSGHSRHENHYGDTHR